MSLIEFKLARAWAGGITVAGMASVNEDSVSFKPTGLLSPLMRKKAFELALTKVQRVVWTRRGSTLEFFVGEDEPLALQGPDGAKLAAALWAMGLPATAEQSPVLELRLQLQATATLTSGPVHYKGLLALGPGGLFWECSGSVEQLMGIEGISLSPADIASVQRDGNSLTVTNSAGNESRFLTDAAERAMTAMWDVLQTEPVVLDDVIPAADDCHALFSALARPRGAGVVHRGVCSLSTDGTLTFAPLHGSAYTISNVVLQQSAYGVLDPDAEQYFDLPTLEGKSIKLIPHEGAPRTRAVREFVRDLPMLGAQPPSEVPKLKRVRGEVESARIDSNQKDEFSVRPANIVHHPDGLGLVLPEGAAWQTGVGVRVRLLVGMGRSILEIHGRFLGTHRCTENSVEAGWPADRREADVLLIAILDENAIRRMPTRREAFRVPTSDEKWLRETEYAPGRGRRAVGSKIGSTMVNLSVSGCALKMREEWPAGTTFELNLPLQDGEMKLETEVVYAQPLREGELRWWRHGTRFCNLSERDLTRLAREVTRREVNSPVED